MAGGGFIAAATDAAALGGVEITASDDVSEEGEVVAVVGSPRYLTSGGTKLVGGSAAECQRPSCQDEKASVVINAPAASPPKRSCLFMRDPDGKPRSIGDNHDNWVSGRPRIGFSSWRFN